MIAGRMLDADYGLELEVEVEVSKSGERSMSKEMKKRVTSQDFVQSSLPILFASAHLHPLLFTLLRSRLLTQTMPCETTHSADT